MHRERRGLIVDKTITSPIEHGEARRISPTKLIRRSGILAIAIGAWIGYALWAEPAKG
jgi:hypothetical protein